MSLQEKVLATLKEAYPGEGSNRQEITPQGSSKRPSVKVIDGLGDGDAGPGESPAKYGPKAGVFEPKPMKQGSSKEADDEDLDSVESGKKASDKAVETNRKPIGRGAGAARNFKTVADATSVINQKNSAGNNRGTGSETEDVAGALGEEELKEDQAEKERLAAENKERFSADVKKLFASETDLSEEFKDKALALFEAYVETRVAAEVEVIENRLAEEAVALIDEERESLVGALDEVMNDIAEQWLNENAVAIEGALRTEVAENFMEGLKNLFAEHYIDIPEERIDVVDALAEEIEEKNAEIEALESRGVEVMEELIGIHRAIVVAEVTDGLADTEVEKFASLTENVSFEDVDSYKEKLSVIRNQYFPKKDENGNIIESVIPVEDGTILEEEVKSSPKTNTDYYIKALRAHASTK